MEISMRKIMFTLLCCLFLFSSAFGDEFKSIRDLTYKGISFSSSVDDLKAKGFSLFMLHCNLIFNNGEYL
jgi:transposase-like protein